MPLRTSISSVTRSHFVGFLLLVILLVLLPVIILVTQRTREIRQQPASHNPVIYQGMYPLSRLTTFEADAGKKVAIIMDFFSWQDSFDPVFMDSVRAHGSIPLVSWGSSQGPIQPQYALANIINGRFDAYITQFAQAAKAWDHPFFLRFDQEMNDTWPPWSEQVNGNKPGQFVSMWRHVHDIFAKNGATNATWVWCPDAHGSLATLKELYPGDSYVDWACMDGYNKGKPWRSFSQIFSQTYQNLLQITSKPQLIGEMACAEPGGSKANWITDAFSRQLPIHFPNIKAFIWWNVNELATKGWDWRIESSPASQQAFAKAMRSPAYATNQFAHLDKSPIPPL
jgi:mannan endo-1,4-beta-mannosidase